MYRVKSIFGPTLQGEGLHAGMPCVFLRLAGCNAWDGRPETRAASACPYCDTDFRGGENFDWAAIDARFTAVLSGIEGRAARGYGCVLTGGEPLLQADTALFQHLAWRFAWVDIETNGTRPCPPRPANVFLSCSPKVIRATTIEVEPDWWKILIPDQDIFLDRALANGKPVFVQPTCPDSGPHGAIYEANAKLCLDLCYARGCRMSIQLHKYLGIE